MTTQQRAGEWHRRRFPEARLEHIALKLGAEAGEVFDAVIGTVGVNSASGDGNVVEELADVMICVYVIMDRCYPDDDIDQAVHAKLDVLTDPTSGHRSAYRE